jgi:hypothetical protein
LTLQQDREKPGQSCTDRKMVVGEYMPRENLVGVRGFEPPASTSRT